MCSYLIALAIGELESRDIGPRSKVWSEKSMVEQGAYHSVIKDEVLHTLFHLQGEALCKLNCFFFNIGDKFANVEKETI